MKINDLNNLFPNDPIKLQSDELLIKNSIKTHPKYTGFIKILNSFFYLFSDDINKSIDINGNDLRILLYSEAFKRIRSSYLLAISGYYIDANSILRSVFELNKGINAIQNGIIEVKEYFSCNQDNFQQLSDREKNDAIKNHTRRIDNLINNFDDKDIPNELKDSLRKFKTNMHNSVHKSFNNLVLNHKKFYKQKEDILFCPDKEIEFFELYLNNVSFMILMFLKNLINSDLLLNENKSKVSDFSNFIQNAYLNMPGDYHSQIVKYIKLKF